MGDFAFGWSAETVVLLVKTSKAIYDAFQDAPREYHELRDDYAMFHGGLQDLNELLQQHHVQIVHRCNTWKRTMEQCEAFQKKNMSLVSEPKDWKDRAVKVWATTKYAFSNKEVQRLRSEIRISLQILSFQCSLVNLRSSLKESEANKRSRAEIDEIVRRSGGNPLHFYAHELHSLPAPGFELAATAPRARMYRATESENSFLTPHFRSGGLSAGHTSRAPSQTIALAEMPGQQHERLRQMCHELEVYDAHLRLQENALESAQPQVRLAELSDVNYHEPGVQPQPVELPGNFTFDDPPLRFASAETIRRENGTEHISMARTDIRSLLERVKNAQMRMDSMASLDSGYGTMDSHHPTSFSQHPPLHSARTRPGMRSSEDIPVNESPLSTSPASFGLGIRPNSAQSSSSQEVTQPQHTGPYSYNTSTTSPTTPSPMIHSSAQIASSPPPLQWQLPSPCMSPVIPAEGDHVLSRPASTRSATDPISTVCTGCILQITDTHNPGVARQYPAELCTACGGQCETQLSWYRRPTGGITLLTACTRSNVEVRHDLSGSSQIFPHIRHYLQGETRPTVSFKEQMTKGVQYSPGGPVKKSIKTSYIFKSEAEKKLFQEIIYDKDLLGTFFLDKLSTSAGCDTASETLRVWRERRSGGQLSLLLHGALFEKGRTWYYECPKSAFKTVEVSRSSLDKTKRLKLYLLPEAPASPTMDRRASLGSINSSGSTRSKSTKSKMPAYIELDFDKTGDECRRFLRTWEPGLMAE